MNFAKEIPARSVLALALFASFQLAAWELPGIYGDAKEGWRPGVNFHGNPCPDAGAKWLLLHRSGDSLKPMESGKAYKFNFVLRSAGDSFDPETFFIGKKLFAASTSNGLGPESLVVFQPGKPGRFSASVEGAISVRSPALSDAVAKLLVLDSAFAPLRELQTAKKSDGDAFKFDGAVDLKAGESLALSFQSEARGEGGPGRCSIDFKKFKIAESGSEAFSGELPTQASAWKALNPAVSEVVDKDGELAFSVSPCAEDWVVFEGPAIELSPRSKFAKERTLKISCDAKTENAEGFAMHVRAKQNEPAVFTRNCAPHFLWESALELTGAQKLKSWTEMSGSSSVANNCSKISFSVYVAPPKSGKRTILLRKIEAVESFKIAHLMKPEPFVDNNVFFKDDGAFKIEFANAENVKSWSVRALDENGETKLNLEGSGRPEPLLAKLPGVGFWKIVATSVDEKGEKLESAVSTAVVGAPLPEAVRMNSRFGSMRVHGSLEFWKKSGCRWDWGIGGIDLKDWILKPDGSIVPPPNWKPLKYPADYSTIYTLRALPKWLFGPDWKDDGGIYPPKDWALFERLFEAFAKANPELPFFTPWNEPNGAWRGTSDELIKFNMAIAEGVKRGEPRMKVYGPCFYSIDMNEFLRCVERGMFDKLEGVNMHAYVPATKPEDEFIQRVVAMNDCLKKAGKGNLPVMLTEFGWTSVHCDWQTPVSQLDRARYVARSMTLLTAQNVDDISYFCFQYVGGSGAEEPGYALLGNDGTPSPAYASFENVLKWLSEVKKGDARWFRLSPDLHMVVAKAKERLVGAAWTCEGEALFRLPAAPLRATDMLGRPLTIASREVTLSPSPLFFELPFDAKLLAAKELPAINAGLGKSFALNLRDAAPCAGTIVKGSTCEIATNAKPGVYTLLGKDANGDWALQPVEVPRPLEFKALDFGDDASGNGLEAIATATTTVDSPIVATLTMDSGDKTSVKFQAERDSSFRVVLPVPGFKQGAKLRGVVDIESVGEIPFKVSRRFEKSVLASRFANENEEGELDWSKIEGSDFSKWSPSKEGMAKADCSASLKTAVGRKALHVRVEVEDDVHLQSCSPSGMWQEDSLQLAFDVDAFREWQFNNIADGRYNGHRIFYYSIGLPSDGRPAMIWRNRANCPGVGAQCAEPRIVAKLAREGTKTIYDLAFPWATLGLEKAPEPGEDIGFAVAVNDADKGGDRHWLRFGNGIVDGQEPERFATLRIRQTK